MQRIPEGLTSGIASVDAGSMTNPDPRLDRRVQFDDRSRGYPIRTLVADQAPRSYTWRCGTYLNQGSEGACVGFSIAHEIAARPVEVPATSSLALSIYDRARELDDWPGEDYDGTSVLAGMQAAQEKHYFGEYRWAFSLDDLILAVGHKGPAVLGINWYEGMMDPDDHGYVHRSGDVVGGHAILCRGVGIRQRYFYLHNSWGQSWGPLGGTCKIAFHDLEALLDEQGEACIPVTRIRPQ